VTVSYTFHPLAAPKPGVAEQRSGNSG
jgi:hypothetical protein